MCILAVCVEKYVQAINFYPGKSQNWQLNLKACILILDMRDWLCLIACIHSKSN